MDHCTFAPGPHASHALCVLVTEIRRDEIARCYLAPYGIDESEVLGVGLPRPVGKKKLTAAELRAWFQAELAPVLLDFGVRYLVVGDAEAFKTICKLAKADPYLGYVQSTDLGPWQVVYVPNYRQMFYDPDKVSAKIAQGMHALRAHAEGRYEMPGSTIVEEASYPKTVPEIRAWLKLLHREPVLACDIEAFSLKHHSAGIGSIAFSWKKGHGVAFPVDLLPPKGPQLVPEADICIVRDTLREFFETYRGKLVFHNGAYDITVLVYQLWMGHLLDNEGLLAGLEHMLRSYDDTKLIAYLATNSCAGNELGLKVQSQEYAGNYAIENITDIRAIPLADLLQYNLVDCFCTLHVLEKHWPTVVRDKQRDLYEGLFKRANKDIIQMQLTGMPVSMARVVEVKQILGAVLEDTKARIQASRVVQRFTHQLREEWVVEKNAGYKTITLKDGTTKRKVVTMADVPADIVFNPASADQLQRLVFRELGLPVLGTTKNGQPETGGKALKALLSHTRDQVTVEFLSAMIEYKGVEKIFGTFIPALEGAVLGPDGWHYLFGNFNLGGTVSGRLSSSAPNLQNLPANASTKLTEGLIARFGHLLADYMDPDSPGSLMMGKLVKSCFQAPEGWFFCGIDFDSLEDRISALTTKDPNKLKVYTDGYDGHCLRAVAYYGDRMPDIDPNDVASVNSVKKKYPGFRQSSKTPTFLLTYGGTFKGMMEQCGFTMEEAKEIEARYHTLYRVSDEWVAAKLKEARVNGYVTVAFGLRVRTPLLLQTVTGTSRTPFQAEAEGRTAGNALGQSYCLLNSRAMSETMEQVRASEYRHLIKPSAQIHDANYFLVRDCVETMAWLNRIVVKACQWQELPEIQHELVKLGGALSVFWPSWAKEMGIPNGASPEEILDAFTAHAGSVMKEAA